MKVPTRVGPLRVMDIMEVEDWTEHKSIGVRHTGRIGGWGRFELSGDRKGSRLVMMEQLSFPWYMGGAVTEWFARPVLRRIFRVNLISFQRWVEAGLESED